MLKLNLFGAAEM